MATARVCTHGSGPNIARCRPDGHLEHTKAPPGKGRSECPHRDADGKRCGNRSSVLPERQLAELLGLDRPAAAPAEDTAPTDGHAARWAREAPAQSWRELLAEPSGDPPCHNQACQCGDPPVFYTAAHTATICPVCGPEDCWEISGKAYRDAQDHAEAARRRAAREGAATANVPQRELDDQRRALKRDRAALKRRIKAVLADQRLTAGSRSDFEDLLEQAEAAPDPARIAGLEEQLVALPRERRRRWQRPEDPGDGGQDQAEDLEEELEAEDQEEEDMVRGASYTAADAAPAPTPQRDPWWDAYDQESARRARDQQARASRVPVQLRMGRDCDNCVRHGYQVFGRYPRATCRARVTLDGYAGTEQWLCDSCAGNPAPGVRIVRIGS